jgi:anthraniloyl-CoA monooxygenase
MRIVCIGGGPAGLYFGLLMKKENPAHQVTVVERNKPYDTFGWGVVFSDATMENMRAWDPKTAEAIETAFNHWDDIEVLIKGRRMRTTGHGFVGIGRKKLLNILQERCEELGVELVFEREVDSDLEFPDADLIVASDGINSKIRNRYVNDFRPTFTSSTPTPRLSSSRPPRMCSKRTVSTRPTSSARSPSARSCSPRCLTAPA